MLLFFGTVALETASVTLGRLWTTDGIEVVGDDPLVGTTLLDVGVVLAPFSVDVSASSLSTKIATCKKTNAYTNHLAIV
mgnify:CR=1 FL=1